MPWLSSRGEGVCDDYQNPEIRTWDSFGEVSTESSGRLLSDAETVRLMIDEAVLAESVGINSYNIGEHYRPGHVDSAGHVILAAIAGRTERIRLGTAVTVLSTQDPVRVYTQFATLDAVSNGRAQLIVGRGSLTESFPLFGFDLADYETLFEEKLDLLMRLLRDQPVTWSGTVRSPLTDQRVQPAIAPDSIPVWVGVGGTPQSVIRAARYGLPLMLAIIGGPPSRFAPYVELYKRALDEFGHPPLPVGMHSLGFVARTDEEAAHSAYWAEYQSVSGRARMGASNHGALSRQFDSEVAGGALSWVAGDGRREDGREHPCPGPEPLRSQVRHRTPFAGAPGGVDRAVWTRGDSPGPGAAGGAPVQPIPSDQRAAAKNAGSRA